MTFFTVSNYILRFSHLFLTADRQIVGLQFY